MKELVLIAMVLGLAGCGSSNNLTEDNIREKGRTCPGYIPMDRQEFRLSFLTSSLPAKLSVIYNGVEKYNDCTGQIRQEPPVAMVQMNVSNPLLLIKVLHLGSFPQLPSTASLEIRDLQNCSGQSATVFQATQIPLAFQSTTIAAKECGIVENVAQISFTVN